jgi:hypothetical protein
LLEHGVYERPFGRMSGEETLLQEYKDLISLHDINMS